MKDSKTISLFLNTATKALQIGAEFGNEFHYLNLGNPKTALERTHVGIRFLGNIMGFDLKDVDAFYGLLGPGSNTGIRLGLTIPRTIYAFNPAIRIYGISTLDLYFGENKEGAAALSDRNGNLYLGRKKDSGLEITRIDKKDIPSLEDSLFLVEDKDTVAKKELEGKNIQTINVVERMYQEKQRFEDFSNKEEEFLPEYLQKI